jgi:hypothetical protein
MQTGRVMKVEQAGRCRHEPRCPGADAPDRGAAHTVASHPEQGWSLLCNGVLLFHDTRELLPSGEVIGSHRPTDFQPSVLNGVTA